MSVLLRPNFPEDIMPSVLWHRIETLDGRVLSRTHSVGVYSKWRWIIDNIKADCECTYDDIDIEDSPEDGEFITVDKRRYARVHSWVEPAPSKMGVIPTVAMEDYSETEEHKQAMEERETITANAAAQVELERLRAKVAYLENEVDTWKERYEAADEALSQTIRDFDKLLNEVR
jgi:hypothetical protein